MAPGYDFLTYYMSPKTVVQVTPKPFSGFWVEYVQGARAFKGLGLI